MPHDITYAHARNTPGAARFKVVDAETGSHIADVVEADVAGGWYVQIVRPIQADPQRQGHVLTRRVERAIRIIDPAPDAATQQLTIAKAVAKRARKAAKLRAAAEKGAIQS